MTSPATVRSARRAHSQSPAQTFTKLAHGCHRLWALALEDVGRPRPVAGQADGEIGWHPQPWAGLGRCRRGRARVRGPGLSIVIGPAVRHGSGACLVARRSGPDPERCERGWLRGTDSARARALTDPGLLCRVEGRRVTGRVRWLIRRFRTGPQSETRRHVSSSRLVKPSVPLYGTGLSCWLRPKVYVTVRAGSAFGRSPRLLHLFRPNPSRLVSLPLEIKSPSQVLHRWTSLSARPCLPCCRRPASSRAPSLHGNYPASTLLLAHPPPSRLRPTSRCCRL